METIVNKGLDAYSFCYENINNIHKQLEQYKFYMFIVNLFGNISIKIRGLFFNYHLDPELPFQSNMILTDNNELLIDYEKNDFGKNSLILNKFNHDKKEYIYSKLYLNEEITPFNKEKHIENTDKSNHKFLAVQYIHPTMSEQLIFNIDETYYSIGNNILDSTFIKYFLKKNYHSSQYVFDYNYILNIIDKECNFHTLDYNSYIHIYHDKWTINNKVYTEN